MKAVLTLKPGCRLFYDCPMGMTDDPNSNRFFDTYRGKYARYVGPAEELFGPLNPEGRLPGRYAHPGCISVQFEGDTEIHHGINILHFIVHDTNPEHVKLSLSSHDVRLGDLHELSFYPGDLVRLKNPPPGWTSEAREVTSIFLRGSFIKSDGLPRYLIHATVEEAQNERNTASRGNGFYRSVFRSNLNAAGDELRHIARGNVWALYNDPDRIAFSSDEDEQRFWTTEGISELVSAYDPANYSRRDLTISSATGLSLDVAWKGFLAGHADLISVYTYGNDRADATYRVRKLHKIFEQHRPRVRAFTQRMWAPMLSMDAA